MPDSKATRRFEFLLINQVFLNVTIAFIIKPEISPPAAAS